MLNHGWVVYLWCVVSWILDSVSCGTNYNMGLNVSKYLIAMFQQKNQAYISSSSLKLKKKKKFKSPLCELYFFDASLFFLLSILIKGLGAPVKVEVSIEPQISKSI